MVSVPHPKCGTIVWTCVKEQVIDEKEDYKEIGLRGFDYSLFVEKKGGGEMRGTRRVPISETSHQIVARRLGKTDEKNERSGLYEESCYIEWGREMAS